MKKTFVIVRDALTGNTSKILYFDVKNYGWTDRISMATKFGTKRALRRYVRKHSILVDNCFIFELLTK